MENLENLNELTDLFGSFDIEGILRISYIISMIFIFGLIAIKIIGIIIRMRRRKKDDLKLQGYFEKYSDIIVDKVIERINEQNKKP